MTDDPRRFKSYSADKPFDPAGGSMMRIRVNYILHKEERRIEPVDCRTTAGLLRWGMWFQKQRADRVIAQTHIAGCMVSTVFLGLDHGWEGPAVLFETMAFPDHDLGREGGGYTEEYQERYQTLLEAEQGHAAVVAMVKQHAESAEQTAARIIQQLKETR